jgi:hypothetical protein
VLLAKTLLSKSMWGPTDIQKLEQTGLLMPAEEPTAFSSVRSSPSLLFVIAALHSKLCVSRGAAQWYGVVGLAAGSGNTTRNAVVADASEGTFAWCSLRLRGRTAVVGKEEVLKVRWLS